ncbi:GTP cyclohydrolase I FolE2 [Sinimarinibacterium sp. CAU 1509]|uniref:GTP cyclohydrolase FolE2 n=1 Tax=Sinimarinibacterium sp. CAU 1509 TaxID=2562283 RepID=UPI0010ACB7F7|nr:GTP cyclohydrolase FolE2 [Sinimarinibacterium sp. CAU 1509]TJY55414.1 GTP cyclohydrolase I FolE2 [Sinimarinibacterium sp. CAU 1509]
MNLPVAVLPDLQSSIDERDLAIDAVGIKDLRYPVQIREGASCQSTVANFTMTVALPARVKGTHMSRFVELLEAHSQPLEPSALRNLVMEMVERLGARHGELAIRFPFFIRKAAPISGAQSLVDYEITWRARASDGEYRQSVEVLVPATSLCPCSKEISSYGAHNQRSHIRISAELLEIIDVADLIGVAERSASCEVFGLLKRPDEKYVTERAYDNPRFVEDLVRCVAQSLRADPRVAAFTVEAENFESIHNHSAFARITYSPERHSMWRAE